MDLDSVITFLSENLVIPITAVVFITVFGTLFIGWLLKLRRTIHVSKNGVAGTAVVKGLRETGARQNDVPKVAMQLEVTLPGIPMPRKAGRWLVKLDVNPEISSLSRPR